MWYRYKRSLTCDHCGYKTTIEFNIILFILAMILIISAIPYGIWLINKTKCKKCRCNMSFSKTRQNKDFGKTWPINVEQKEKEAK